MSSEPTKNPRIRLLPDGRVTIAGLNYSDARHILTLASLQNHKSEEELRKELEAVEAEVAADPDHYLADIKLANARENCECARNTRWIIDTLDKKLVSQYGFQPPKLSLKEQLLKNKQERDSIRRITEVAMAGGNWLEALLKETGNDTR